MSKVWILSALLSVASAYNTGAPYCTDTPGHSGMGGSLQSDDPDLQWVVTPAAGGDPVTSLIAGESYVATLEYTTGTFEGFMAFARDDGGAYYDALAETSGLGQTRDCGGTTGYTHTSKDVKESVTFDLSVGTDTSSLELFSTVVKTNNYLWWHVSQTFDVSVLVDECFEGSHNCDANASCTDTTDGFTCECDEGFEGDGTDCSDIDECAEEPCDPMAECTNLSGSYMCECFMGYDGDGMTCDDVDECATGTHMCHTDATCSNTDGGYDCSCNQYYEGDGNECVLGDGCSNGNNDCDESATCSAFDTETGDHVCTCNDGYEGDGLTCTEVPTTASPTTAGPGTTAAATTSMGTTAAATTSMPPMGATCDDGEMNGEETGVDCGGECPGCEGDYCEEHGDCASGMCSCGTASRRHLMFGGGSPIECVCV